MYVCLAVDVSLDNCIHGWMRMADLRIALIQASTPSLGRSEVVDINGWMCVFSWVDSYDG